MSNKIVSNPNKVTIDQFAGELSKDHGVIDVNNLSDELSAELNIAGITKEELQKAAGADGQIKAHETVYEGKKVVVDGEFRKLFHVVDRFETTKTPNDFRLKNMSRLDEPATVSGSLYEALKNEVERNRSIARYQKPGSIYAMDLEAQKKLKELTKSDAEVPSKEAREKLKPADLRMPGVDQFSLSSDREQANKLCKQAAEKQLVDLNKTNHGENAPQLNDVSQAIQVAYAENYFGRLVVDKTQMTIAKNYIDKCLDKKLPVMVGVSDDGSYDAGNTDRMTEHFVTIDSRGYDEDGRLFYGFKDPGNGGKADRFFVDRETGKLFKPGTDQKWKGFVKDNPYEVTQVRTYSGIN